MGKGYIIFLNKETQRRFKSICATTPTILIRLSYSYFDQYLRNNLFLNNTTKLKKLRECPLINISPFLWEDLTIFMEEVILEDG